MTGFFDNVKEFLGLLKVVLPLLGLGGAGTSVYTGGNRVFEGFATAHQISNFKTTAFTPDILSDWGSKVVLQPANLLATTPAQGMAFVIGLIVVAYLLLHHLLYVTDPKPGRVPKFPFYLKHHAKFTLLIYAVLLTLLVFPTHVLMFFFTLTVFLLFFSAHLYFHFPIFKQGKADEKITYIIPIFLVVIVALFVPTVYGGAYFKPTVWHADIDLDQNKVWIIGEGSPIRIYFVDPAVSKVISAGNLTQNRDNSWSLSVDTTERGDFNSVVGGQDNTGYTNVPLTQLLTMQIAVRNTTTTTLNVDDERERINTEIQAQSPTDTTYGYPSLM